MGHEDIEKKIEYFWRYKDTGKEIADEVNDLGWRLFDTKYFASAGYQKGNADKDACYQTYYISDFLLGFNSFS
jgi:hypothetical protein